MRLQRKNDRREVYEAPEPDPVPQDAAITDLIDHLLESIKPVTENERESPGD
jgi:hypothetical protein